MIETLERACESEGRDPITIDRTFDLYSVVPEGFSADGLDIENPVSGTSDEIASFILSVGELSFEEGRCDVYPRTVEALEAMQPVIDMVHRA